MRRMTLLPLMLAAALGATAAAAVEPIPPMNAGPEERAELRERLFARLAATKDLDEEAAREAADAVWRFWFAQAPDEAAAARMAEALTARESYDFEKAETILDGLVADAPGWAEAWNQRAFVRFLREKFDESLEDIDRALELEPKHFGALAGRGLILMRQGRARLAQKALKAAVAIHPWLNERFLIAPEPGERI